jgi:hypothetical protein
MSIDDIDKIIAAHEAQESEFFSSSVAPSSTQESVQASSTSYSSTNRYLEAYKDCKFSGILVGAKAMKNFKIASIKVVVLAFSPYVEILLLFISHQKVSF